MAEEVEQGNDGVECGFLVDKITTSPYQKALDRGEIPFCAFAPISTQEMYLLRIQDCSDATRHMLVPASKEEVFNMPGALKILDDENGGAGPSDGPGSIVNYRVAIVAVVRQVFSEEDKQLVVSVDPLLKRDKQRISKVRFLTVDKFADFAFLGFDGNLSEFTNKGAPDTEDNRYRRSSGNQHQRMSSTGGRNGSPSKRSTPKARRGRGGRRRASRKSDPLMQNQSYGQSGYQHTGQRSSAYNMQGFVQQSGYAQDPYGISMPSLMQSDLLVPMPLNEVTVSTTEPGADGETQQVTQNHDILTIAFDQLVNLTNDPCTQAPERGSTSGRGGRRPGRKPGRKPVLKDKPESDEIGTFLGQLLGSNEAGVTSGPKRRGRPPKNRVVAPPENENASTLDAEEFENYEKRVKLHMYE